MLSRSEHIFHVQGSFINRVTHFEGRGGRTVSLRRGVDLMLRHVTFSKYIKLRLFFKNKFSKNLLLTKKLAE